MNMIIIPLQQDGVEKNNIKNLQGHINIYKEALDDIYVDNNVNEEDF